MKTPFEKSIVDVINTPSRTLVVIDLNRLKQEELKENIQDATIQKLLPFHTALVVGENYVHVQNSSAYVVTTNSHEVLEGDTLCAKRGATYPVGGFHSVQQRVRGNVPTCPGCIAKAKAIIAQHLQTTEPELS
jgi:hypothetical protein